LLDDVYRPMGTLPKRGAFAEQEDAMIGLVESGAGLSLIRDSVLASRRREPIIGRAFSVIQAVWDLQPGDIAPAPIEAARSRKSARR
jgi:hypothetical protein